MNRKAPIGGVCLLAALGPVVAFARFAPPPAQTQTAGPAPARTAQGS